MFKCYSDGCIQGRPQHGHTFLIADTDGKGRSSLEEEKPQVAGEPYWLTSLSARARGVGVESPSGPCSRTIILCKTKKVTAVKLRKFYGFIYALYMHITSPLSLGFCSSFQRKQCLFSAQGLWLLPLQPSPVKLLLQKSLSRSLFHFSHS